MKSFFKCISLLLSISLVSHHALAENVKSVNQVENKIEAKLMDIKNFRQLSPILASAGMPKPTDFALLKQNDFQHIINLIPGDFSEEQQQVSEMAMSFEQIPVDWHEPKLADFQNFVELMNKYQQDKVLVHCRLNYRASAFVYLYQTMLLNKDEEEAKHQMHTVWQPEGVWLDYIKSVQRSYQVKTSP